MKKEAVSLYVVHNSQCKIVLSLSCCLEFFWFKTNDQEVDWSTTAIYIDLFTAISNFKIVPPQINHQGFYLVTRIVQEWAAICMLLVLSSSYREWSGCVDYSLCRAKARESPYHDRLQLYHTFPPWHHSPSATLFHPKMAHPFNNDRPHHPQGPHHHQELFWQVSSGICTRIHRKQVKICGFKISFQPTLVHL